MLARDFDQFEEGTLDSFSRNVLTTLVNHSELLTPEAADAAARMHAHNSLAGYHTEAFVERSFYYLGQRLTRANPLGDAFEECQAHLPALALDLSEFYPILAEYCARWRQSPDKFV